MEANLSYMVLPTAITFMKTLQRNSINDFNHTQILAENVVS